MIPPDNAARRRWMGVLAKATPDEVDRCWSRLAPLPAYELLRRPEIGLMMVRGRVGGDGAPFNLGEMTVTRCSVRLSSGTVGHAWRTGRAPRTAEQAAVLDALLQETGARGVLAELLAQLDGARVERRAAAARKAAATKVEFFTLARES